MIIGRELILVLLYYIVICSASNDDDTTTNPPVLKPNVRRYFSSTASSSDSLSLPSDGDADHLNFDPYMGLQRELQTDSERSLSYASGSMSMMPYDLEFPTPAPRIEEPWPCVEALTTSLPPTFTYSEATSSLVTSYMPTAAMMLSTSPPTFTQTSLNSAPTTSSLTPPPTFMQTSINSLESTYVLERSDLITSYMPTTKSSSTPSPPTCTPAPISTTFASSFPPTRLKKTGKECTGGGEECRSGCCNFNCHLDSNRQQKYCIKLGPSNEKCSPFLCK